MVPPPRQVVAARVLAGLSQAELAKRADVAVSALSRYEAGHSMPRIDTIAAIVRALTKSGIVFTEETDVYEIGVLRRKKVQPGGVSVRPKAS
jgi:transcriptional regulator with XRE-family HTH domain